MPATPVNWRAKRNFGLSKDLEFEEGLLTEWWKLRYAWRLIGFDSRA